jgi:tetratricopeptide (TPR) repeat protein
MLQTRNQSNQKVDQLMDVAVYLRRADKLVKNGKYAEALDEIHRARKQNPKNLYALAYEERVRSIMAAAQTDGEVQEQQEPAVDLEKISTRAIAEAQRSADAASKKKMRLEQIRREEEAVREREEQQRAAIRKKVYDLLIKAREYHHHKEFNRALDEIARVHMIDPSNETAGALEEQIRADQDKAHRQAEIDRKKRQDEEEQRRKEYVKAELERIRQEGEERKKKAEEARMKAQQLKVQQHISHAKKLCEEGYLDDALAELAFVVVIDPLNEEVIVLEQQIRELEEEQQAAELERLEREKQKQMKARRETQEKIQKHVEAANEFIRKKKFSDALRVISSAYVLDPLNKQLQLAEEEILKSRDQWLREAEEIRQREEDERRRRQEEEMKKLLHDAKRKAGGAEDGAGRTADDEKEQKISEYLESARTYLAERQYENALGEIALAFVIDPFNEEINRLEEEILHAQQRRRTVAEKQPPARKPAAKSAAAPRRQQSQKKKRSTAAGRASESAPSSAPERADDARSKQVARHIGEARRLKNAGDYENARNELMKAFMLDPLNDEIKAFEDELQQEYARQQEEAKREKAIRTYSNRANQFLAQEDFAKAMEEVEKGLKTYPDSGELAGLKQQIAEARKRWKEVEQLWDKVATADGRDAAAGRADMKHNYKEALSNYYTRVENDKKQSNANGDPESVDIEEEIRKVYNSWREEQVEVQRAEHEASVQKHIKKAKELLEGELYDDALAEIAFARMIEENRKDLHELEARIWNTWNEKAKAGAARPAGARDGEEELKSEERGISLRLYLRTAEEYAERKEYARALDEITKAYCIDPLNDDVARAEERIRKMQGKGTRKQQLTLVYPSGKAVGDY